MKHYLLVIIAVLTALIVAIFSIDTNPRQYNTRIYGMGSPSGHPVGVEQHSVINQSHSGTPNIVAAQKQVLSASVPDVAEPSAVPLPLLSMDVLSEVSPSQLPPLDAGMVNVTGGKGRMNFQTAGYRVNSHPGEFAISVPYDPSLLPQGFTEDDIQTYVYDKQYHRWVAIQRDSVNMEELLVCSRFRPWEKTLPGSQENMGNPQDVLAQVQGMMSMNAQGDGGGDSPLDFINAVLKTPEMPENSAYVPTSIKDLKAENPLDGMTLIQPPTANNTGTANMSYPIEIPAGRQGMQPNLALTYSSGGGNGWLGIGWDISIPSITVETRWGVPRYDSQMESEVYVYGGEQLVTYDSTVGDYRKLPHRTNQWTSRYDLDHDGYEQFYPRKNEAFDSIVRHGNGPSNYWWSVTHKNGVTDYYGKRHGQQVVDYGSVLCDPITNNIAQWMLTESVDPFGNWVRYYYNKEQHESVASTPILNYGTQVYIDSIVYTGYDTVSGKYSVKFNRNDGRKDVITNGRYGFREVTASTLCNVEVLFGEEILHRYYFVTENSRESSYKTRLTDLVRMDPPIQDAGCNNILDPSYWMEDNGGTDIEGSFGKANIMRYNFSYYDYPDDDTLFGGAVEINNLVDDYIQSSFDDGAHAATALGATSSKDWSVGGTVCVGLGPVVAATSNSVGGNFSYSRSRSKGLLTLIDLDGDGRSDKVYKRGGVVYYRKNIADDEYHFHYGNEIELQGVSDFLDVVGNTPSFGVQGHFAVFNVNGGIPITASNTKVYFSDVNGDGLPDIVTDGGVLFNNIDNNGNVYFASFYTLAQPNPDDPDDYSYVVTSSFGDCDGGIIYDGEVNEDISCDIDYGYVTIPVDEGSLTEALQRLQDQGYIISDYTDSTITFLPSDTVHTIISCDPGSNEPDLDAVRVWVAPCTGLIRLESTTSLVMDESESFTQSRHRNGVVFSIQYNGGIDTSGYALTSNTPHVFCRDTILQDDESVHGFDSTFFVYENDILFFRLQSKGSRTADKVYSNQHITYQSSWCQGKQYDSDYDFVLTGNSYFQAPKRGTVTISGNLIRRRTSPGSSCVLKIVKNTTEMYSLPVSTSNSTTPINRSFDVNAHDSVKILIQSSNLNMDWGSVSFQPFLQFEDDPTDQSLIMGDVVYCYPPVIMNIVNFSFWPIRDHLRYWFGSLYNGWGQFAYNNNFPNSANLPIDVTRLIIPKVITGDTSDFNHSTLSSTIDDSNYGIDTTGSSPSSDFTTESLSSDIDNLYNPLSENTSWVSMIPDGEHGAYMGFGNTTAIMADQMHNTRQRVVIEQEIDENENDYDENGQFVDEIPEYDDVIPVSVDGSGVKTIRKKSVSVMGNLGAGVSVGPNLSVSLSLGDNEVHSDFVDLNGDRFPDILVENSAQYTMPWGGLGSRTYPVGPEKQVCKSIVYSYGMTAGGGYPDPYREEGKNPPKSKIAFRGASLSGSYIGGGDEATLQYMDINGDGLPDMVTESGDHVRLNMGYGFQPAEPWNIPVLREGTSNSFSASGGISFSYNQYSIGGGVGKSGSESNSKSILMDFNGDGLPDMVEMNGQHIRVKYNYGNGQWSSSYDNFPQVYGISGSSTHSTSSSVDLTVGFTVAIVKMTVGVQVSPSNKNFTRDEIQLADVNGDGYPDFVTSDSETRMWVRYNKAGKTNMLKTVTNFTGSTVTLDYDMPMSSYEKPQRSWNLASVEVLDPASPLGGNRTLTTFEYGQPHYDRYERMDYGYDTVITKEYDTDHGDTLYRYTVDVYENRNFTKRGEKTYDCLFNAAGDKYVEHLYDAVIYHRDGSPSVDDDGLCANADLYIGEEYIETNYYEGLSSPQIVKLEQKMYDNHRNIIQYMHHGNQIDFAEYFTADIQYATSIGHNMVSLPVLMEVKNHSGVLLRKRTATYTPQGRILQLTAHNTSGNSLYDFTYDCYGNMDTVLQPQNKNGQRLMYTYQYDTIVHIYPTKVTNESLGYYSSAEYDFRFGKPTKTLDINQNETRYTYDCIGRLSTVVAPREIDSLILYPDFYTVSFFYTAHHYGVLDIFRFDQNNPLLSWTSARHFDSQHPDTGIFSLIMCDNFGRLAQTRKDAEVNGQKVRIVSGKVEYDCFGRLLRQCHPFVDTSLSHSYNSYVVPGTATLFEYDMLDRKTRIVLPTHDTTLMEYGFGSQGGISYFRTKTTDALHNTFTTLTGTLGQTVSQLAPGNTKTTFIYDAIGQLKQSTDPDNISTSYDYDLFGQMVHRNHPDAGDDNYYYDQSGNLIAHTNSLGDSVIYNYHFNQLRDIIYPRYPANNVHYRYGSLNATNLAINAVGRVIYQEDASGWQKFEYGKLGELTDVRRTMVLPCEKYSYTFHTNFEYDSWNRIQNLTYPDGEVVSYQYDKGGMLKSVKGVKNGVTYKYIDSIKYNKFELKDAVYYGNGTHAHYTYDTLQRLSHLVSYTSPVSPGGTEMMQDLYYTYDSVSNITDVVNYALQLSNGLGGSYDNHYVYDNLYRLSNAEGHWHGISNLSYNLSMGYSKNGRVGKKVLTAGTLLNGNFSTVSYGRNYHYNTSSQKNTIIRIDGSENHDFQWDATGNMTFHLDENTHLRRILCWDEENRLQGVADDNYLSYYQYDANGERTYKLTGSVGRQNISGRWSAFYLLDNPTLYPSPYMVVTRKGYTKHYYAENERIASRIGGGGLSEIENPIVEWEVVRKKALELNCTHLEQVLECLINPDVSVKNTLKDIYKYKNIVNQEKDCYWYHPDHLGSSSWITYTDGSAVQHLHYLPWGEDFVDQRSTIWNAMYTFSAKEKDTETSYSYFGSRYYSSDLSIWLSVDPMSDKYPSLSFYTYCADNPVKLADPNGESPIKVIRSAVKIVKKAYAIYKKTGRLTPKTLKKAGLDEIIDIAGDLYTLFDSDASLSEKIAASVDIAVGSDLNSKGRQEVIKDAGKIITKVKREASTKSRKKWEEANNKPWPKDPDNPNKNQDVSHKKPLADGGTNDVDNIEPKPHSEHIQEHKDNGDFKRWGAIRNND